MIRILNQLFGLYVREIKTTFRSPAIIVLSIIQPLLWIIFFGSSFASAPRAFLEDFFHTDNYIAFLLSGQLATSMLFVGMFSSLSLIQDKKSGYLRRIMVTPTRNYTIFLSKVLGASTRGMLQVPIVFAGVILFGCTTSRHNWNSGFYSIIIPSRFRSFFNISIFNHEKFRLANPYCSGQFHKPPSDVF